MREFIAASIGAALMYLSFAFALWEINPYAWGVGGRLSFMISAVVSAVICMSIPKSNAGDKL